MRIKTRLRPFSKSFTRDRGEYFALKADGEIERLLGAKDAWLLFTENQVRVAYQRWLKKGKPRPKPGFLRRLLGV